MRRAWLAILLLPILFLTDQRPPDGARHRAIWLDADGLSLRALVTGAGDTTLVLLHGYGEHLLTWRAVLDPLASRYRVLAFDLPGFGGSDKPDRPYTREAMVGTVTAVLERWTRPPVILIGHSMGGQIAAETAIARPDLVAGLVLIAPAGLDIGLGGIADSITPRRAGFIGAWEAARATLVPMHDRAWLGEPEDRAAYDPAFDPAYRRSAARVLTDFDFEGMGERYTLVQQPTLVIWGTADPVVPYEVAPRLMGQLPCASLAVLERTLHRPQVERPDTTAALILGFLRRQGCEGAKALGR